MVGTLVKIKPFWIPTSLWNINHWNQSEFSHWYVNLANYGYITIHHHSITWVYSSFFFQEKQWKKHRGKSVIGTPKRTPKKEHHRFSSKSTVFVAHLFIGERGFMLAAMVYGLRTGILAFFFFWPTRTGASHLWMTTICSPWCLSHFPGASIPIPWRCPIRKWVDFFGFFGWWAPRRVQSWGPDTFPPIAMDYD